MVPKLGERKPLGPKQLRTAALIAAGWKQSNIARELNLNETTICGWKKREDFQQAIETAFAKVLLDARNRALGVFTAQMDDDNKWLAQNAAGRALAQYNAVYAREQDGSNVVVMFGAVDSAPGMPATAEVDAALPEGIASAEGDGVR